MSDLAHRYRRARIQWMRTGTPDDADVLVEVESEVCELLDLPLDETEQGLTPKAHAAIDAWLDSQDSENATLEAINNIRQAIRVIAPIWESMHRFGHSQADDVAGAQADLEQAIRFLTGEEQPT